jgi:predicted transcriptional regulator
MPAGLTLRGIHRYSYWMADTTLKISEDVRDRLRDLADERGISTRALVEQMAQNLPTRDERDAAVQHNIAAVRERFGIETTAQKAADTSRRLWELAELRRRAGSAA